MIALAASRHHRVYALDFWGFGESAKRTDKTYGVASFVEMVHQFMNNLGIQEAPVAGHSMGGTVALQFALRYPERVSRVAVVGSPILGRTLNPFLQLAGYGWIADLVWRFPFILASIMKILLSGDSQVVQRMIFRDVQRTSVDSFFRSIGDLRDTDLRETVPALPMPAMGIFGARDNIVSPRNADLMRTALPSADIRLMHHSRHFPMVDETDRFVHTLQQFVGEERQSVAPIGGD
jgi:pimeloyl-ACP methyl ester carboxylesterase